MALLKKAVFVCLDCETTGLDVEKDRIIEVAACQFTFDGIIKEFDALVDPKCPISEESQAIHNISAAMLEGKPTIDTLLPDLLAFIGNKTIVGHGVGFDIDLVVNAAKRAGLNTTLKQRPFIDTLRLARHYGDSPNNSLGLLAKHFNIPFDDAHRALNDVRVNVEVFKKLTSRFKTTEQLMKLLSRPIKMKRMPLGKHKGRPFSEIPLQYLQWAAHMDFDQDLLYSIRSEIKNRKQGKGFSLSANPFAEL